MNKSAKVILYFDGILNFQHHRNQSVYMEVDFYEMGCKFIFDSFNAVYSKLAT